MNNIRKHLLFLLLLNLLSLNINGQDWNRTRNEFIVANIAINGIVGGTGALLNKKKNEKGLKIFFKGFSQGCLGGTFQVLGKSLTYQINSQENLSYAWASRITNAVGNSITQNAANNINFWEEWHFNLGLVRLDYKVKENKFQARILPSTIYGLVLVGSQAKLNIKQSFQTGILIYESDGLLTALGSASIATAQVSSIGIDRRVKGKEYFKIMAHETMHILQYDNIVHVNPYFKRLDSSWKNKSNVYRGLSKYVYFDMNGITFLGAYLTQIHKPWHCRIIEKEADFYSTWRTWPRCN